MKTSVIGFPRVGVLRELKFATERYFRKEISEEELKIIGSSLRKKHWDLQASRWIDHISSNDFSFYDTMLDTAVLLGVVPQRYQDLKLSPLECYFAMARGYQGEQGDVKALAMKKWFNTNYHYMVPELEDIMNIQLSGNKLFEELKEASELGIVTKPVLIGPFTFLKLARCKGKKTIQDYMPLFIKAYQEILTRVNTDGVEWIQLDEPYLVYDLDQNDQNLFLSLYMEILTAKGNCKVLLQTYFGDVRDIYSTLIQLDVDGIGLDFVEGKKSLELVSSNGYLKDKVLFAGLVNGKNIWRNDYTKTLDIYQKLCVTAEEVVISTSCSLLHVPYTLENETKLSEETKQHFAFAYEKLGELMELKQIINDQESGCLKANKELHNRKRDGKDPHVEKRLACLQESDYHRLPLFEEREAIQKEVFALPLFPVTTIGSFPQTREIKAMRSLYKKGQLSEEAYMAFNKDKIKECIELQEQLDIDVLVHGEFERNDMVEFFGEHLNGYLFTEKAWVQSYGTRCVKPPVIWGDVSRPSSMTVDYTTYAQSLSNRPVKGMLTGPVTILNWSFPREDIPLKESALQLALAIRDEVLDLEKNGIRIIQIDEAALREKLPLRKSDWHSEYLDWAIPAFNLVHSGVQAETQIHTHMCYSEFEDIIADIDAMDADVISFEAFRSDLSILSALKRNNFRTQVGPGVYDIHSPRIPTVEEMETALELMLESLKKEKLWINPDCGLKTRGEAETVPSLANMVTAAKELRKKYS